jgi:two-component system cell cycle response regulator DivK
MAHAFDARALEDLLTEAERSLTAAVDHERRLTLLVGQLERGRQAMGAGKSGSVDAPPRTRPPDVLTAVRELCVAARQQRQLAEAIVTRMVGDGVRVNGAALRRRRVLIVDDNADNREIAAATLEASGFDVITTANGLEAVIVAHYASPSVVLMDVSMPVLDGLEATRLLKSSSATSHVNVIAYTAKPELFDSSFSSLFAGVLTKPVDPSLMIRTVERFADK